VGHIKKILLSFLLLTLFVTYQVSITMFTHVHYVNGVMIAHSHPYKGTHSHTASNIIVIAHFAAFHSLEVDVHYDFTPERPILFTVEIPESIPVTAGTSAGDFSAGPSGRVSLKMGICQNSHSPHNRWWAMLPSFLLLIYI
jgi:hypothetical protein